jgi:formylmethanofuran dehydrogenase subunit E
MPQTKITQRAVIVLGVSMQEFKERTPEEQRRIAAQSMLTVIEEQSIEYERYIQSPEWKAKADRAKYIMGYRCQVCYSSRNIEAHHRTYERLGNEWPTDITVLCDDCHELFHNHRRLQR